jgi:hypothetical protein
MNANQPHCRRDPVNVSGPPRGQRPRGSSVLLIAEHLLKGRHRSRAASVENGVDVPKDDRLGRSNPVRIDRFPSAKSRLRYRWGEKPGSDPDRSNALNSRRELGRRCMIRNDDGRRDL